MERTDAKMQQVYAAEAIFTEKLSINTLGSFTVRAGEIVLSEQHRRAASLWEFFMFMLTFRGKMIPVADIVATLWPRKQNFDPFSALHGLAHRLRRICLEYFSTGREPFTLEAANGRYRLQLQDRSWLDADLFLRFSSQAEQMDGFDNALAVDAYRRAIHLYRGEYLPGISKGGWAGPVKEYYRAKYLENLIGLIGLLETYGRFAEILLVCEQAFQVDRFLDKAIIHRSYAEALTLSGRPLEAQKHLSLFNRHRSAGPQNICSTGAGLNHDLCGIKKTSNSLGAIVKNLTGSDKIEEIELIDLDMFRFIFRFLLTQPYCAETPVSLLCISCRPEEAGVMQVCKSGESELVRVFSEALEPGDLVTRWSRFSWLVLLRGCTEMESLYKMNRLKKAFRLSVSGKAIFVKVEDWKQPGPRRA